MAFDKCDPTIPTERWLGQIRELEADGGFNGFIGPIDDEESLDFEPVNFIVIPLMNIIESERQRIARMALFFCDVELEAGDLKNIRGIEFIERERFDHNEWRRNADQFFAENPGLLGE